jgi:oxygen-independent coproporphyrinogen-3 oxidase
MYGLPGQSYREWERGIWFASSLPINHISTYKLYVFKDGPLNRQGHPRGVEESEADTAKSEAMQSSAAEILGAEGFTQYSLTEYARDAYSIEYIKSCFDGSDLLPLGPGAFGRCGNELWENSPYVKQYGSGDGMDRSRALKLSSVEAFKRDVILGLWLLRVDLAQVARRHSVTIGPRLLHLVDQLRGEGLIEYCDSVISLDKHQRFSAGQVMGRLANLNTEEWGFGSLMQREFGDSPINLHPPRDPLAKLNQLLRTARRDSALFNALETDPSTTLRNLGYSISDDYVRALIKTIQGERAGLTRIWQAWTAIQQEHTAR